MRSLLERTKQLSRRYNGLQATKDLFPEEYCQLGANLILNDDALEQIDIRLIDLLNEHCFPCYDCERDFVENTRERPYTGLGKISICPSGFDSYDYYYHGEGVGWYFVRMTSDECFDYFGYDYRTLDSIERVISLLPDSHPLSILPDVVRYVWAMTGNLWLDSHVEGDNEYTLSETEVIMLEEEYRQALVLLVRLRFFDNWFCANPTIAQPAIAQIFRQITGFA
ncbi:MAG: hypothetical protein AAGE96_18285 [Cyanobacteria bacterium P01_G01_bin.19]